MQRWGCSKEEMQHRSAWLYNWLVATLHHSHSNDTFATISQAARSISRNDADTNTVYRYRYILTDAPTEAHHPRYNRYFLVV